MGRLSKWFFILGGILLVVLIGLSFFGGYGGWGWGGMGGWGWPGPMMGGGYYGGGFGNWWIMPLISIVFFILVIVAAVKLGRMVFVRRGEWNMPPQSESALEILKKRYASGEITKEEYEQKKKDIL